MLFNSLEFAIFLIIVFAVFWVCKERFRPHILMLSSFYFYMQWKAEYLLLIIAIILISYLCAVGIAKYKEKDGSIKMQKFLVALNCLGCLGLLFYFKYFNFLSESISSFLQGFNIPNGTLLIDVILPVGISFYTFQTVGYVIDVYRGDTKAEKDIVTYAAFVSFFPQLVAGPIERSTNLLPQIKKEHVFDYKEATYGLKLMAWGYYKKLVISDVLAPYIDRLYGDIHSHTGIDLIIGAVFFSIMIYCDFSGYSDIAIGTARLFGIKLMKNFDSPFFSKSVEECWRRWHISLSGWFRDYLYIPMGGGRKGLLRKYFNWLVVFAASGLWHGAAWHFVIWGVSQGIFQILENIFKKPLKKFRENKIGAVIATIVTFSLFTLSCIFFRAQSVSDGVYSITHLFEGFGSAAYFKNNLELWLLPSIVIAFTILLLAVYDYASLKMDVIAWISEKPKAVRYTVYAGLLLIIMLFKASSKAEFVYFQF